MGEGPGGRLTPDAPVDPRAFVAGALEVAGTFALAVLVGALGLWTLNLAAHRHELLAAQAHAADADDDVGFDDDDRTIPSRVVPVCKLIVPDAAGSRVETRHNCVVPVLEPIR